MKVSLKTIEYLNQKYQTGYDPFNLPTEQLLQKIGAQLGAVEEVTEWGPRYEGAVVAKVVACVQHPNADKLRVCTIDDGGVTKNVTRDKDGFVEVVCGAPNAREGITVAWLPPGSTVPSSFGKDPFVLEARDPRGVVSNGMLGSPKELGIGDDHDGILEIDADKELMKPGTPFKNLYGLDDVIIDCENKMFTHRPDCFGSLGVARELAGIQGQKFRSPEWYTLEPEVRLFPSDDIKDIKLEVELPELVPRYMLVAIENIKIAPSPIWLQSYLSRIGVRPINNIVDLTNFLMMETGQPLHAFDFDKVSKNGNAHIIVRKPKKGETLTLLGGKTVTPREDAILICDEDKPIALGGVMGGENSEIDAGTTRILIECATFDMYNIRRTSMEHGIFTDAVTRFTKGQSPWQCPAVLAKAVEMTGELSPSAKAVGKPMDINHIKNENQDIEVTAEFINERLGSKLNIKEIAQLLENVEFKVMTAPADKTRLHITAPFWRMDIEQPEDIVEEIGRLYGYDKLPVELPARSAKAAPRDPELSLKREIRGILAEAGANEVLTYSFVHGDLLKKAGQPAQDAYAIRNALSPDLQHYRLSLTPSLLDKVHMNIRAGFDEFALFELNRVHARSYGQTDENVPTELNMLSLVYAANDRNAPEGAAFYAARKYLDFLAHKLGIALHYAPAKENGSSPAVQPFDPARSATVTDAATGKVLGQIGEYRADVRRNLKLPVHTAGFELSQEALLAACKPLGYRASSRFPKVEQDISLKIPVKISHQELVDFFWDEYPKIQPEDSQATLNPLDIYMPSPSGEFKNVALRLKVEAFNRTLKAEEVNSLLDKIAEAANRKFGAERL